MRWLKNLIGRSRGYGCCERCKDTWTWKAEKGIDYKKGHGIFALCVECFNELDINQVIWWYKKLLNRVAFLPEEVSNNGQRKKILSTLIKNIKRAKDARANGILLLDEISKKQLRQFKKHWEKEFKKEAKRNIPPAINTETMEMI